MRPLRLLLALAALFLLAAAAACGGGSASTPSARPSPPPAGHVRITYYGHSMFTIESPGGVTILTDPNQGIGYRAPRIPIDVITVSHEHFDHNKIGIARGALVIRGLDPDGGWANVDQTVGDVRIRVSRSFHDEDQGALRGKNAMFVFEVAGLRIVHAGDLGHGEQTFKDVQALHAFVPPTLDADVFMLPVGGHLTIGPQEADEIIQNRHPKLVIPMHYRTAALHDFPDADKLAPVDDFLQGKTDVQRPGSSIVVGTDLPPGPAIAVLDPQPD
ncbi:MAG TPA: MBL fold metallo-hydrolase [Dehalococcoidia bacterium]|nr:MBL fold metallo-hydrolase [Dehalococcoidia bacterium]